MVDVRRLPKISVIVPVYCVEQYIEKCAESLFEQTLENIEYIFINDCTTDGSIRVLTECIERYPQRLPQTVIINLEKNGGLANARNEGFKRASGEYIISLDSDDYVEKDAYEKMLRLMVDGDYDIVMCNFRYFGDEDDRRVAGIKDWHPAEDAKQNIHSLLRREGLVNSVVWTKLVRSSIIKDSRTYKPRYDFAEDVPCSIQWYALASKVGFIDEPLYNYRLRGDSQGAPDKIIKCNINLCKNINDIKEFLKNQGIYGEMYDDLIWFHKFQDTLFQAVGTKKIVSLWKVNTFPLLSLIWSAPRKSFYRKIGETIKRLVCLMRSYKF